MPVFSANLFRLFSSSSFRYKRNGGKYWKNFVNSKGAEWEKMNLDWYNSFSSENKLVVFYDQLVSHTLEVMQKVADFLQVPISEKIWPCVMNHKQGIYKRSKKKLGIEVFSSKMRELIIMFLFLMMFCIISAQCLVDKCSFLIQKFSHFRRKYFNA